MSYADLPALNATLNGVSALLLTAGYSAIRAKRIALHRAFMISAFACSTLFLVSYVTYHWTMDSPRYPGTGFWRGAYLTMLISHIILAAALAPLAVTVLLFAATGWFDRHRRLARWTFPIWIYVSVTGVAVYLVIYQVYGLSPSPRGAG